MKIQYIYLKMEESHILLRKISNFSHLIDIHTINLKIKKDK
jgi:hypothetical protein